MAEFESYTFGITLPKPEEYGVTVEPSVSWTKLKGSTYYVTINLGIPSNARIEIYRPVWDDMTNTQEAALNAFFDLVFAHETGHENIYAQLAARFGIDGEYKLTGGPKGAERAVERLALDQLRDLAAADEAISAGAYDELTGGGFRQSDLGGTDFPSLDGLCDVELPITSTFDVSDEGWTAVGDPAFSDPIHHLIGGNPGGFIEIEDIVASDTWYWAAPQKFLGSRSHAYGTLLTFDLKQSALDRQYDARDVILEGGGEVLNMRIGSSPGLDWTSYAVPLDMTGGWVDQTTGLPASQQQIEHVLASLTQLQIRGEYRVGADTGGLDNVAFGVAR